MKDLSSNQFHMDEESHTSTSQDSFYSREAVRINTNPLFQIVNLREVHCALCGTIYSPGNEANRPINLCQECEVWLGRYNEESGHVLGESRQLVEEGLQGLVEARRNWEENRRNLVETQRDLEEFRQRFEPHRQRVEPHRQDLMEAWRDLGGNRRNLQETQRELEEFRQHFEPHQQRIEPHQQRVEQILIEAWRDLEVTGRDLEVTGPDFEETQRHSEEFRQRFEPHRQLVERRLECLPRLVITEEHEKKHNGLECAICLDPLSVGSFVNQLPCLHFFHPLCIVPWLKVRMSCPTCRYKLSSAFHNETMQNSNRRIGVQAIVHEGSNVNSSSVTYDVNEPEVVVSESYNETTDSSVREREGRRGGWFLFAAAPIVSLVGIALVECFQNFLGDGRGRGSTGHVKFPL